MKGRPPKPTILKRMSGTDQPCRVNENEMKVSQLAAIPEPPFELNERAEKEYYIICAELLSKKMLHLVDLVLITSYANEISIYIEMEKVEDALSEVEANRQAAMRATGIEEIPEVLVKQHKRMI